MFYNYKILFNIYYICARQKGKEEKGKEREKKGNHLMRTCPQPLTSDALCTAKIGFSGHRFLFQIIFQYEYQHGLKRKILERKKTKEKSFQNKYFYVSKNSGSSR